MNKVYDILVDQIIEKLESGVVPWSKPWSTQKPANYITGKAYRWLNKLILMLNSFTDNRYLTAKQIKALWWSIKKWAKSSKIYYYKTIESEEDDSKNNYSFIKYYSVFNITQTNWIDYKSNSWNDVLTENTKLNKARNIVINYKNKPMFKTGLNASYDVLSDIVTLPMLSKFKSKWEYYSTLFHELIHSTWNPSRLNRFWMLDKEYFWSKNYSKEELIAELWTMFLCLESWIDNSTLDNSKNYTAWWLKYIKWNKKELISASMQAEKATDYILWN